jgi:acyl phosphate:glycerol-3-phosphate acyltransferase
LNGLLAALAGYLLGSAPTANLLARMRGIDLRSDGSTNPGANNARRLGGISLALPVLLAEAGKGAAAVILGGVLNGASGMVISGIAAVIGNVYNVWYRFEGGKGLGISLGVLLAAIPGIVPIAIVAVAGAAWLTHSTGKGTVWGLLILVGAGLLNPEAWLPTPWGLETNQLIGWLIVGVSLIVAPKHLKDVGQSTR